MKKFMFIFLLSLSISQVVAQISSIGFMAGFGATIVDVEKACGYDDLEDWDTWAAMFKVTGVYDLKENLKLGGELGANRLYYWEYREYDGLFHINYWDEEWTVNAGVHLIKYFRDRFYIKAGAGMHLFVSDEGVVAGLLSGTGYDIPVSDYLSIPVELRVEMVFGNDTPCPVMFCTGIKYHLK